MSQPNKPTVLTSDDIINYTIEDVVMPLPGYNVVYPASEVGAWYQDLLQQDGFANSSALQHKIRSGNTFVEVCVAQIKGCKHVVTSAKLCPSRDLKKN